jgi:hypothetical protein
MDHKTIKMSPISTSFGIRYPMDLKISRSYNGYSKFMSSPISVLNTTNKPNGNDSNIMPKMTDKSAK